LYEQLKEQLCKLHDKEIALSAKDNDAIFEHLRKAPAGDGSRLRWGLSVIILQILSLGLE
jgi:hypothetical protein